MFNRFTAASRNYGKRILLYLLAGLLTGSGLLSCSSEQPTAGVVSETGNGEVVGVVQDTLGVPRQGIDINLVALTYDPNFEDTTLVYMSATSNEEGFYIFAEVPPGTYNVFRSKSSDGLGFIHQGVGVDSNSTSDSLVSVLRKTARVQIYTEELEVQSGGYIYIPGSDVSGDVSNEDINNVITIEDVPVATYSEIYYKDSPTGVPVNIIGEDAVVTSSDVYIIGPYASWTSRIKVSINTSSDGADVPVDISEFPLSVNLNSGNFDFSKAGGAGQDLRFTAPNGIDPLPYEIEFWHPAAQRAQIWVKLDTVFGHNSSQFFYMYTGNGNATSRSSAADVFDPVNQIVNVWHFSETPGGSPPQFENSAWPTNPGVWRGTVENTNAASTNLGNGVRMNGTDNYVSTELLVNAPHVFSVSLWFNAEPGTGGNIFSLDSAKTGYSPSLYDRHLWLGPGGRLHFGVFTYDTLPWENVISSVGVLNDGSWHYVCASLSPSGMILYVDGTAVSSDPSVTSGYDYSGYWRMGYGSLARWTPEPGNLFFTGMLDEVRISVTERSADWFKLSYENQKGGSSVLTLEE